MSSHRARTEFTEEEQKASVASDLGIKDQDRREQGIREKERERERENGKRRVHGSLYM